jgi:phosphohistidine phosphatase
MASHLIFIMRHGSAAYTGSSDAERPLTSYGREQAARMGKILADYPIETCWVSPFTRAQQTLENVLADNAFDINVQTQSSITPSGNKAVVGEALLAEEKNILMISHMPLVSNLTQYLTAQLINFNPADCAVIEISEGKASLKRVISA